jgi:hypothetical protein
MPKDFHKPADARASRFFEPSADAEFSWPPRAEDLEACAIVPLEGEHAGEVMPFVLPTVEVEPVFVELSAVLAPAPPQAKARPLKARFSRSSTSLVLPLPSDDVDASGSARSAWLAVLVAAACVVIAYSQFRIEWTRDGVPTVVLKSAPDADPPILEVAPEAPGPTALVPAPRSRANDVRREPVQPPAVAAAVRPEPEPMPSASLEAHPVAASLPTPVVAAAYVEPPRFEPSRPEPLRPEPAPVARPEPVAMRAEAAPPIVNEEDGIRTTLTRWRTAYSELDAGAAQAVWPSVDVRALRTAFRGIKSQELHFDRCQLTVTGARAQAACSGRAVYVPGVGDRSPRTSSREWKFDLQKADDRWTIASASARSS